jgi:hypothetical protein
MQNSMMRPVSAINLLKYLLQGACFYSDNIKTKNMGNCQEKCMSKDGKTCCLTHRKIANTKNNKQKHQALSSGGGNSVNKKHLCCEHAGTSDETKCSCHKDKGSLCNVKCFICSEIISFDRILKTKQICTNCSYCQICNEHTPWINEDLSDGYWKCKECITIANTSLEISPFENLNNNHQNTPEDSTEIKSLPINEFFDKYPLGGDVIFSTDTNKQMNVKLTTSDIAETENNCWLKPFKKFGLDVPRNWALDPNNVTTRDMKLFLSLFPAYDKIRDCYVKTIINLEKGTLHIQDVVSRSNKTISKNNEYNRFEKLLNIIVCNMNIDLKIRGKITYLIQTKSDGQNSDQHDITVKFDELFKKSNEKAFLKMVGEYKQMGKIIDDKQIGPIVKFLIYKMDFVHDVEIDFDIDNTWSCYKLLVKQYLKEYLRSSTPIRLVYYNLPTELHHGHCQLTNYIIVPKSKQKNREDPIIEPKNLFKNLSPDFVLTNENFEIMVTNIYETSLTDNKYNKPNHIKKSHWQIYLVLLAFVQSQGPCYSKFLDFFFNRINEKKSYPFIHLTFDSNNKTSASNHIEADLQSGKSYYSVEFLIHSLFDGFIFSSKYTKQEDIEWENAKKAMGTPIIQQVIDFSQDIYKKMTKPDTVENSKERSQQAYEWSVKHNQPCYRIMSDQTRNLKYPKFEYDQSEAHTQILNLCLPEEKENLELQLNGKQKRRFGRFTSRLGWSFYFKNENLEFPNYWKEESIIRLQTEISQPGNCFTHGASENSLGYCHQIITKAMGRQPLRDFFPFGYSVANHLNNTKNDQIHIKDMLIGYQWAAKNTIHITGVMNYDFIDQEWLDAQDIKIIPLEAFIYYLLQPEFEHIRIGSNQITQSDYDRMDKNIKHEQLNNEVQNEDIIVENAEGIQPRINPKMGLKDYYGEGTLKPHDSINPNYNLIIERANKIKRRGSKKTDRYYYFQKEGTQSYGMCHQLIAAVESKPLNKETFIDGDRFMEIYNNSSDAIFINYDKPYSNIFHIRCTSFSPIAATYNNFTLTLKKFKEMINKMDKTVTFIGSCVDAFKPKDKNNKTDVDNFHELTINNKKQKPFTFNCKKLSTRQFWPLVPDKLITIANRLSSGLKFKYHKMPIMKKNQCFSIKTGRKSGPRMPKPFRMPSNNVKLPKLYDSKNKKNTNSKSFIIKILKKIHMFNRSEKRKTVQLNKRELLLLIQYDYAKFENQEKKYIKHLWNDKWIY